MDLKSTNLGYPLKGIGKIKEWIWLCKGLLKIWEAKYWTISVKDGGVLTHEICIKEEGGQ